MSAINKGDVETVESFLDGGKVNLNVLTEHGFDYVLSSKHASTILPVLLKHSNPSIAIENSIRNNNVRSFQLLLNAGVSPSFDNNHPVQLAAQYGSTEILEILLKTRGVDLSANENAAIRYASEYGHLEIVKILLSRPDVDPSANNNEAIRMASEYGHLEIVKELLSRPGVDPTADDNAAFRWASINGHLEVVKELLLRTGVDPFANNNEAIQLASGTGNLEVVKLLISLPGVHPSANDNEAIRMACEIGHPEILKELLSCPGVDPSVLNSQALELAVENNHLEIVKLLLEDGRVDPTVDDLAVLVKAEQMLQNPYFDRNSVSDMIAVLQQDQMIGSIIFLRSQQELTPTRFLQMIDSKRALIHSSYIESILKFPQVSELLSGILGIDLAAAKEITTLEHLNEEMVQLMKSLRINDRDPLARKRLDFLWRYFGAAHLFSEENTSFFNQLTVWKLRMIRMLLP